MKSKRVPAWLAVVPGVLAGWLAFRVSEPAAEVLGDSIVAESSATRLGLAGTEGSGSPEIVTTAKHKFPLAKEKLTILRRCHRMLRLDFRSFLADSDSTTRSAFEILRQVIDLTPAEETALMREFERGSGEVVAYEKRCLQDFSASPGRIAFQVETGGPFHDGLTRQLADAQIRILGENRAAMFAAITGSADFCSPGSPSAEPSISKVEIVIDRVHGFMRVDATIRGKGWSMISTPASDPMKQEFERFGHLIDDAAKLRFREAAGP